MEKLIAPELHYDADIIAYQAASACDGRMYKVTYIAEGEPICTYEKYKKDADLILNALHLDGHEEATMVVEYNPEPFIECIKVMENCIVSSETRLSRHTDGLGERKYYLSIGGSFREKEYPMYKNNRAEIRRPHHLGACKEWLIQEKGAAVREGLLEADDLMAMGMTRNPNSVICSIDKDLLQVAGAHWNWKRGTFVMIDEEEGRRSLYTQVLVGDTSDGIPGIHKVGPVTAKKLLENVSSEWLMYCVCLKAYIDRTPLLSEEVTRSSKEFGERMVSLVRTHARLLYLLRTEGDSWEAPKNE